MPRLGVYSELGAKFMSYRSDEVQKRRESEPQYWFNKSSDLRAAAGAIHFCSVHERKGGVAETLGLGGGFDMNFATWPVYLMLCGLSLELMFKAVIVASGGQPKNDHNLRKLAASAKVTYLPGQLALLDILTECVYWFGKYPAPLAKDHAAIKRLDELATDHLTEAVPGLSIAIRRSIQPHPLEWEAFSGLWQIGADTFRTVRT